MPHAPVCPSIHQSIHFMFTVHQFLCLFVCSFLTGSAGLPICLSVCLFARPSVYISVCLFMYLSVRLSVCLCVCLCLPVSLFDSVCLFWPSINSSDYSSFRQCVFPPVRSFFRSVHLFIYFVCQSIRPCATLSSPLFVFLFVCSSIFPSSCPNNIRQLIFLSLYSFVGLFVSLNFVHPSVHPPVHTILRLPVCPPTWPSVRPFISSSSLRSLVRPSIRPSTLWPLVHPSINCPFCPSSVHSSVHPLAHWSARPLIVRLSFVRPSVSVHPLVSPSIHPSTLRAWDRIAKKGNVATLVVIDLSSVALWSDSGQTLVTLVRRLHRWKLTRRTSMAESQMKPCPVSLRLTSWPPMDAALAVENKLLLNYY